MSGKMPRKRMGSAAMRRKSHGTEEQAFRSMPPASPRRGTNSKKEAEGRRALQRLRRAGKMKKALSTLRILFLTGLVGGGLAAGGWYGYQAFEKNSFLSLTQVDVVGNKLLDKAAILEKAGLELGVKLPAIRVKSIEASVGGLPAVGTVSVRRIFPSRIEIRVQEKEPVAMGFAKAWYGLASDGTKISGMDWAQSDLPIVDGFAVLDSLQRKALGRFLAAAKSEFPALYGSFSQLALRRGEGLEIILRDGRFKVLVALETGSEAWRKALAVSLSAAANLSEVSGASAEAVERGGNLGVSGTKRRRLGDAKRLGASRTPSGVAASSMLRNPKASEADVEPLAAWVSNVAEDSATSEKLNTENLNKSLNSLEFLQALKRRESASLETAKVVDLRVEGFAYVR